MEKIRASITAVHGWVPDYILNNKELEKLVDTTDEWILSRTGISERHILKGEGKGSSDIAAEAVKGLLKKRGIGPEEIELVICATTSRPSISGHSQYCER
jgi:3-oxoacyl-[acyl-carrier-protein] synthase III